MRPARTYTNLTHLRLAPPLGQYRRFELSRQLMLVALSDWIETDRPTAADAAIEVDATASAAQQIAKLCTRPTQ